MMGLRRISVLLYVVGWIWNTPAAGSDVGVRFYGRHVRQLLHRWIFPMGPSKELVYRDVVTAQMDLVARLHAACTWVDPATLQRVMRAIPRRAQACLDMHGGHFGHLL
ncbi:hypothetical protein AVEN_12794-1 [Araneus ventricosus]|uniref:Secreted protein n=1 Tax=Araneus ventricosus TaxID=182803 RepID=A0A4Y2ABV5_ARAVE|nr:hypothetical protein AVEN_12794-1 [Araneus ventricosus]